MTTQTLAETRISRANRFSSKAIHAITLADAVNEIRERKNAHLIDEIRGLAKQGEKDEYDRIKERLPGFVFAGEFSRRCSDCITGHSGLMVLDFDHLHEDVEKHKAQLAADPHTVLLFLSPSGTGLKLVIRIEPDAAAHGESFDSARVYFRENYGLEVDPSGRDVARFCFISHDPDAVFREQAEVLHRRRRKTQKTHEDIEDSSNQSSPPYIPPSVNVSMTVDDVIVLTQPTQIGQRHRKLFELVRGLRFECGLADMPMPELKKIVRRWFDMALDTIGTKDFDECWSDFVNGLERAKKPLLSNALALAWDAVQRKDFPPESEQYESIEVKQLVALCWHLRDNTGTFYLSTHTADKLLGKKSMQILRWLNMLAADGVIILIKKGVRPLASTYRWGKASTALHI